MNAKAVCGKGHPRLRRPHSSKKLPAFIKATEKDETDLRTLSRIGLCNSWPGAASHTWFLCHVVVAAQKEDQVLKA